MVSHYDLAKSFVNNHAMKGKGSRMFIDGDTIYSYGYHFPIALRRNGVMYVNEDSYSSSTSKHTSYVRSAIGSSWTVVEIPTSALKALIGGEPAIVNREVQPKSFDDVQRILVEFIKSQNISPQRTHIEVKKFIASMKEFALLSNI